MVAKTQDTAEASELLTVDDLAKLFKCSARHVHRIKDKLPRGVRLGKLLRWKASDIAAFLAESQTH